MREVFSAVYISKRAAVAAIRAMPGGHLHQTRRARSAPPGGILFTTAMIRGPLFAEPRGRGWYIIADAEMREVFSAVCPRLLAADPIGIANIGEPEN
jgi:hypothetical protein